MARHRSGRRGGLLLGVACGLVVLAAGLVVAGPARGHAFGVQTDPAQGARLDRVPDEVVVELTEPLVADATRVSVQRASGGAVPVQRVSLDDDRVVRAALDSDEDGVYVVAWQVVSAVDGHETAGEFAFAVGDADAAVPSGGQQAGLGSPLAVVGSWLLAAGLAAAAGAMVAARFLPVAGVEAGRLGVVAWLGLLTAVAGGGLSLSAAAGGEAIGSASGAAAGLGSAQTAITVTVGLLAAAMLVARRRPAHPIGLGLVAAAGAAWTLRGHVAAYAPVWAGVVNFVHLAAAVTWVGTLGVVAALVWRARADADQRRGLVVAYARIAAGLVLVVAVSGVVSATQLLDAVGELAATAYGRVLAAKIALVAAAVGVAVVGRQRGLRLPGTGLLRRVTATEVVLLVGVLALTAVLSNLGPPAGQASTDGLLGPPPLGDPVVRAAGLAGTLTVGVAVDAQRLQIDVLTPSGPVDGADVEVAADLPSGETVELIPRDCGAGCFTQAYRLPDGDTHLTVDVDAPERDGGRFTAELTWPPPPRDPGLLRDVAARLQATDELEVVEHTTSASGQSPAETRAALTGEQFLATMPYAAGEAADVRPLPGQPNGLSFALPAAPMWVTMWLDDHGRVREQVIVNPGHHIRHTLTYPDDG